MKTIEMTEALSLKDVVALAKKEAEVVPVLHWKIRLRSPEV